MDILTTPVPKTVAVENVTLQINYVSVPLEFQYKVAKALKAIEASAKGQKTLSEFADWYSQIPADHRWEGILPEEVKNNPEELAKAKADDQQRAEYDPKKLAIFVNPDSMGKGAKYQYGSNAIILFVPSIFNRSYPMRDQNTGKITMAVATPEEILIHEMDHGLRDMRKRIGKQPIPTTPCMEELATAAQREYIDEVNQQRPQGQKLPKRELYKDTDFQLKMGLGLAKQTPDESMLALSSRWLRSLEKLHLAPQFAAYIAPSLVYDAGCTALSDKELLARTRKMLNDYNISFGRLRRDFTDAQLSVWVDHGLKQQRLEKYDPFIR